MSTRLGEIIKKRRKELGLSYRKLSELSGISHSHISSIEKGVEPKTKKPVRPSLEIIEKLAKGLQLDLGELLSEVSTEEITYPNQGFFPAKEDLLREEPREYIYLDPSKRGQGIPPEVLKKLADFYAEKKQPD